MVFSKEQGLAYAIYNLIGIDNVNRIDLVRHYKGIMVRVLKYGEWYEERLSFSEIESSDDPDKLIRDTINRLSERAAKDKKIGEDFMSRLYED